MVGDLTVRVATIVAFSVGTGDALALVGLAGVVREDGRLGGAAAVAPPTVVRLEVSSAESGFVVRAELGNIGDDREGFLFSSPSPAKVLTAGFRVVDEAVGLVGGLLMVLPPVLDDKALVLPVVGDATFRGAVLSLEEVVPGVGSPLGTGLMCGFAPVVVRLSIATLPSRCSAVSRCFHSSVVSAL